MFKCFNFYYCLWRLAEIFGICLGRFAPFVFKNAYGLKGRKLAPSGKEVKE